jgi:hypothetical protein
MLLFIYAWGGRSGVLAIFLQSGSYEVYQAILCNNCKYSLNISGTINNVFVISDMVLRYFYFLYVLLFFMVGKVTFQTSWHCWRIFPEYCSLKLKGVVKWGPFEIDFVMEFYLDLFKSKIAIYLIKIKADSETHKCFHHIHEQWEKMDGDL